jgi:hypothetical protein
VTTNNAAVAPIKTKNPAKADTRHTLSNLAMIHLPDAIACIVRTMLGRGGGYRSVADTSCLNFLTGTSNADWLAVPISAHSAH